MNNLQIKRNIRFVTVEKAHAWVVLAFVVEIQDGKTVPVSEPRIVKVIQKKVSALAGNVQKNLVLVLGSSKIISNHSKGSLVSPFYILFKRSNLNTIPWVSALPPTFSF